jgi:transporter family-2 protein
MNQALYAVVVMSVGGVLIALQAPTNAMLARTVGSPVNAALISFLVGFLGLVAASLALHAKPDLAAARALPWYAWLGGLYGAFFVAAIAYAAPRIGVASALTIAVGAQLVTALVLDHLGAFGLPARPIDLPKIAGVLLVGLGVVLVRRG